LKHDAIQAEHIKSALTTTEFATEGGRSVFVALLSGRGVFRSDEIERDLAGPCLIWAPSGWPARLSLDAGTRGFLLRMPESALGRALPLGVISAHVRQVVGKRIFLSDPPAAHLSTLQMLYGNIERELRELKPGADTVLHHYVSLLLIEIWRAAAPPVQSSDHPQPHRISDSFLNLVELHLQNHWTVAEYAKRIGVSRDRLNVAVRRSLGVSPHLHLQRRLIEEAKALLVSSNLQVAEIGYKLGFSDAAYFNRFFQRHLDMPPGRFRNAYTPLYRGTDHVISFADWP